MNEVTAKTQRYKNVGRKKIAVKRPVFVKPDANGQWPARDKAVDAVTVERLKQGLPLDVKEELVAIEKNLQKGGAITSELDSYLDTCTFHRKIVNANWADRVAKELMEWINQPRERGKEPFSVTEFLREKGIYFRDFERLSAQFEILRQATAFARQALADIRERNILENVWNPQVGMFTMRQYSPIWKQEMETRESAKLKQAAASGTDFKAIITDMLAPTPSTEEVRNKIIEDFKRDEASR
jgi:hypothetical protein